MRRRGWALVAAVVPLLAGCGVPIESMAHFTGEWTPAGRTTFAWNDEADITRGDTRLEDNAFFHARLHEAVEWELNLRGIRYSEEQPALLIHHHLSLADHEMEHEVTDESGGRAIETEVYEGGAVVLHIVDAESGEDLWVAWAQANVESAFASPAAMHSWVQKMVGKMFEDWPMSPREAVVRAEH